MPDQPTDEDVLAVIIPILTKAKLAGIRSLDSGEYAVQAIRNKWPHVRLDAARALVRRLRVI